MKNLFLGVAAVAAMMFVACDSDSGTSANDSPAVSQESSSSSVKESSSSHSELVSESTSSSSTENVDPESPQGDESSSSSSDVILSSSTPSEGGQNQQSSSNVKAASSSSSVDSGNPQGDESSSSSSSDDASVSSSSVYDHSDPLYSDSLYRDAYKVFKDPRDGRKYYYLTINGEDSLGNAASVTVMAENLNVGEMVLGTSDLADDSKIEKYCYDNDTANCDRYGGLYQWAEMMQLPSECNTKSCADQIKENHQGICPDGWRLLTYADFYIVLHSNSNKHGIEDLRSEYGFSGYNYSGYSLVGAGLRNYEDGSFESLTEYAFWYYPEEPLEYPLKGRCNSTYCTSTSGPSKRSYQTKLTGFSVRCVKAE